MSRRIGIAALIWSVSILLSRLIGLVREMVIGRVLGGGSAADVFWTAFVVPDFLNYLLAGGALSLVFIPVFGAYLARGDEVGAWRAFRAIGTALTCLLVVALTVLWFLVPQLVPWVAPGFNAEQTATLITLSRIILPAQAFHVLGGLMSGALQAQDRHALPALAPLLYTGCIIAGGLLGGTDLGAEGFAWGVLVGSVLGPFGLPWWGLRASAAGWWKPLFAWRHPDVIGYFQKSLPIMLGWSIIFVDDWLLRQKGSLLGTGAIATLQYAKTLVKVPIGVFGLAAGVAAFPTLVRLYSENKPKEAYATLAWAVRRVLVAACFTQVILSCAGVQISTVIYGHKLPLSQHQDIGLALAIMAIALWAWAAQTVVARGFYAAGNTWIPTVLGTVIVIVAYPLYGKLGAEAGIPGLAAASTIAVTVYVALLMLILKMRGFRDVDDGYLPFFGRTLIAVSVGIASGMGARYIMHGMQPTWFAESSHAASFSHALGFWLDGIVAATTGGLAYVLTAWCIGITEVREIGRLIRKRVLRMRG